MFAAVTAAALSQPKAACFTKRFFHRVIDSPPASAKLGKTFYTLGQGSLDEALCWRRQGVPTPVAKGPAMPGRFVVFHLQPFERRKPFAQCTGFANRSARQSRPPSSPPRHLPVTTGRETAGFHIRSSPGRGEVRTRQTAEVVFRALLSNTRCVAGDSFLTTPPTNSWPRPAVAVKTVYRPHVGRHAKRERRRPVVRIGRRMPQDFGFCLGRGGDPAPAKAHAVSSVRPQRAWRDHRHPSPPRESGTLRQNFLYP